jgi:hypothetical protein
VVASQAGFLEFQADSFEFCRLEQRNRSSLRHFCDLHGDIVTPPPARRAAAAAF